MSIAERSVPALPRSRTALLGTLAVIGGGVMIGLLRTTGTRVDALSQPLSLYALTSAAWLFNSGVAMVALGLGILLVGLVRAHRVARRSVESVAMVLCAAGLIALTVFPDRDPHGTPTMVGWIHCAASFLAFGALPVVPILLGRRHRRARGCSVLPGVARTLAVIGVALWVVLVVGSALEVTTSIPAWRIGGAVERGLAVAELAAAVAVGLWAWRGCPNVRHAREIPCGDPIC